MIVVSRIPAPLLPPAHLRAMAVAGGLLLLAGCSTDNLSRSFGFSRDAPDEFSVTTRAPLSMPPEFSLRPPRPGAPRPQERSERAAAEAALSPETALVGSNAEMTPGQSALLAQTGAPAPANIRNQIDQEDQLNNPGRGFTDRLMFWRNPSPTSSGTQIDATGEAQRLRNNAALGQPPDSGGTPVLQNGGKSTFERCLDIF